MRVRARCAVLEGAKESGYTLIADMPWRAADNLVDFILLLTEETAFNS